MVAKSKDDFMKDLNEVYNISNTLSSDLNSFYKCFESENISTDKDLPHHVSVFCSRSVFPKEDVNEKCSEK